MSQIITCLSINNTREHKAKLVIFIPYHWQFSMLKSHI
jgi:hypothetical protein